MDCDWPGLYHVIPINQSLQATQTYTINGIMYTVHCVQLSLWSAVIGHSHHMVPDLSLADIRTSELPPGRHLSIGQMWSSKRTGQKLCVCLYYWHFFCEWRGILCTPYSSKWGGGAIYGGFQIPRSSHTQAPTTTVPGLRGRGLSLINMRTCFASRDKHLI